MKKSNLIFLSFMTLFLLLACTQQKPHHHPKKPNFGIKKPKVQYTPSRKNLAKMVKELQGSPYVWAEEGPNNFDCSGFTYYLYGSMGINIPRIARNQARAGKRISVNDLQYGDLIFFATNKRHPRKITHVGMYLGEGWFTHASTKKYEVIYSNLFTSPYYKKRLRVCRRYLHQPSKKMTFIKQTPWKAKKIKPIPSNNKKPNTLNRAIVIKAPLKEIEQPSQNGNFYVQVGSFVGTPKSALLNKIKQERFHYKIIQFPKDGKSISKLLIGPYKTRAATSTILIQVRERIESNAFIAEIR